VFLSVTLACIRGILLEGCIVGFSGSLFELFDALDEFVACLDASLILI